MGFDLLLVLTIVIAVGFDFTNGFHDTANAIATSVSTRALTPRNAVVLAALLNLLGAVITVSLFGGKVSNTIAKLVGVKASLTLLIAALLAAIVWNLLTWWRGLPSSSTHALVGGLIGAGWAAGGFNGVKWSAVGQTVTYLVVSPLIGFLAAGLFMFILYILVRRFRPAVLNRNFRRLQVLTAAFVSYSHGSNDAQKTMALITLALVATHHIAKFTVPPLWVVSLSATAIAFGTYAGGWRIIRTLGWRIYKLDPATGMGAQLMSAIVIQAATQFGFPVSTTHVVTGSVIGAGAPRDLSAIKWGVGATIVVAWLLTIPASALLGFVAFAILHTAGVGA